ncbi:ribonuclease kappa-like [Bombyx mandarina]|uniref:Ribonuclease kappa-like n=1 Tax=Bombyx mandarina TaxID=7092 RepID=A0A6J2KQ83_BOMMA|nr:ribonuclease kappa-like [Bombyx mandarina]
MVFSYNCANCCMIISVWGTIQLIIMGTLYKKEMLTLLDDVEAEEYRNYEDFIKKTHENYQKVARNCWIAASIYFVVFIISYICVKKTKKIKIKTALELEDDEISCRSPTAMQRR